MQSQSVRLSSLSQSSILVCKSPQLSGFYMTDIIFLDMTNNREVTKEKT